MNRFSPVCGFQTILCTLCCTMYKGCVLTGDICLNSLSLFGIPTTAILMKYAKLIAANPTDGPCF